MTNTWYESYKAALLETDWTKMQERLQTAERGIDERRRVLSLDHGGTPEERQAITDAVHSIAYLKTEARRWQEQQIPQTDVCLTRGEMENVMAKEFSGEMILELSRTVAKTVPLPGDTLPIESEHRRMLASMRQTMLANGRESTPLKTAWLALIDQYLSDNPSPDLVQAAMAEVHRLTPAASLNSAKATSVNLF